MSDEFMSDKLMKLTLGLYDDDLDSVEKMVKEIDSSPDYPVGATEIEYLLLKARYYRQKRKFQIAEETINVIDQSLFEDNGLLNYKFLIEQEYIRYRNGLYRLIPKSDENKKLRTKALSDISILLDEIPDELRDQINHEIGIYHDLQGLHEYYSRNIENSKLLFEKSSEIIVKTGDGIHKISSILNTAFAQIYLGDLTGAEDNFELIVENAKVLHDKEYLFWIIQGFALINSFRGNIQTSLRFYNSAMELIGPMNEKGLEADILHVLGIIYWERAELDNALTSFSKILHLPLEKINQTVLAVALFYSIMIYLEKNEKDKASEILSKLENITKTTNDPLYQYGFKLANALVMKYSTNLLDKMKAKEEFEELRAMKLENSRLDLIIIGQLSEILLIEYKAMEDPKILTQLKLLMEELHNIGKEQNSSLMIADSYYILSKIAIIEDDLKTAEKYLVSGLNLAEEKQLLNLAKRFSVAYDALFRKFVDINTDRTETGRTNPFIDFEKAIRSIGKTSTLDDIGDIESEKPIMALLIDDGGSVIFKRIFDPHIKINHNLIASFISAINSFSQNTFDSEKPIERINYYEYTIAIRAFGNTLICYIFTGDSFFAFKKLQHVTERLINNRELRSLIGLDEVSINSIRTFDDEPELINLFENIIMTDLGN